MLAHIVINQYLPILQTPINHYCNTLQAPILQIVIYLYCRVQFAGLHHLKGVGQIRHRLPQVATGCPTFFPKSMKIDEHDKKSEACQIQQASQPAWSKAATGSWSNRFVSRGTTPVPQIESSSHRFIDSSVVERSAAEAAAFQSAAPRSEVEGRAE